VLTPLPAQLFDYAKAAHLLNRAGFGGTPAEIEAARAKGLAAMVTALVDAPGEAPAPPDWAHPMDLRAVRMELRMQPTESPERKQMKRELRSMEGEELLDLRGRWLDRMMHTSAPLLEKMTLFWHGHFATSAQKVKDAYWIWLQNETLRRHALGNFVSLTKAMSRDPAMMIYLDLQQSRKEHPNENWARELMELFTIGIGNYTEQDIRDSARAFTGYRVDMTNQQFRFADQEHDRNPKKFMGRSGNFDGDQIIDIIVQQPACAQFIGRKVWRYFVEDDPSPAMVNLVAERLRQHHYELRPVLREIFSSVEFYSERVRRAQIKSPVQYLVQTSKLLETGLPPIPIAQNALREMGQILFAPPNVKGWDGGKAWVSTSTLLFRYNFASYLVGGDGPGPFGDRKRPKGFDLGFKPEAAAAVDPRREPVDLAKIVPAELRDRPKELVANLSTRLFQTSLSDHQSEAFVSYLKAREPDRGDGTMRGLLHLMMSTPQFQLT
jgi:uncharacterized protein (DUF1800 family)